MPVETLRGPHVLLCAPKERDVETIAALGVDPEISRMLGVTAPASRCLAREEAETVYQELRSAELPTWVIETDDRFIGSAGFSSLNREDRRARYAVAIRDPRCLGRGIGTEVTRLVLAYGFETLGLHRIDVRVLDFNKRAIACYRKSGFQQDGRERESALVGDQWHDDLIMSLLEHEYRCLRPGWAEEPFLVGSRVHPRPGQADDRHAAGSGVESEDGN